jgi:NAD(P)-dependent dehydrogenase (short-subunit alcohol dehydrogenase family)
MEMDVRGTLERLFALEGKVALVTGASGGLGSALAEGLAGAGAALMLAALPGDEGLGRVRARLAEADRPSAIVGADLLDPSAPARLVEATLERWGRLDILVNCAGINRRQPIQDVTPETFDQIVAVNLRATYFVSQAAARAMIAAGRGGKIINIASLTTTIGLDQVSVYGATKAGVGALTRTMAVEWARHGIQVNAIGPGFMRTPLTDALWEDPARRRWMEERIPVRRGGSPDELVGLAILLASPASTYISGQVIYADGGFLAGSPW